MILCPNERDELFSLLQSRPPQPLRICGSRSKGSIHDELIMSGLSRLIAYEPDEMIVQCEAGMSLAELEAILAKHNQWIPTLCSLEEQATTVGGALSLDDFHPRTGSTISLRTTVLGGEFATMTGVAFRSGSRVVKSVAGYDTHRSFVGAQGLFGVIVQVTLRVLPRPERFLRFLAPREYTDLLRDCSPLVLETYNESVLVELAGYEEDISEDQIKLSAAGCNIEELSDSDWLEAFRHVRANNAPTPSTLPAASLELLSKLRHVFDPSGVLQ